MCGCAQSEYGWSIVETTLAPSRGWPRIDVRRSLPPTLAVALLALLVLAVSPTPQRTQTSAPAATLSSLPLAAQSLVSRTLGRDQVSYRIHPRGNDLVAQSAPQALSARFGADGVEVRSGEDTLSLRLRATGYGRSLEPVIPAAPTAHANRVSYRRGSLTEWYSNGPLGLEQGFTLKAPPPGMRTGSLTLALSLRDSLTPSLERGSTSLSFTNSSLRYTGLTAFDVRGHRLPARLQLRGETLLIRVDDAGARYPLTIDPFVQQAKLTRSSAGLYDGLGDSVAIAGDTIVVGASGAETPERYIHGGTAYVFVKPAGGWANATETAQLFGSSSPSFGGSVAISGDTIVVGAPTEGGPSGKGAYGAAYVFVKPAAGWSTRLYTAKLSASDGAPYKYLGSTVAISGDTIVAGTAASGGSGAAYVFVKPAGGWTSGTETAKLTASDAPSWNYFGISVGVSGNTVVAGAWNGGDVSGAVYVFVRPAGGWANSTETAKLTASDAVADLRGVSLAISGDTVVAGAPLNHADQGSAYVFVKPAEGWSSGR